MCGRYTLSTPLDELVESFDVDEVVLGAHRPRYNIAPTDPAPVLVAGRGGLRLGELRWGLVPAWARDPSVGSRLINARAESVASRSAFREAFRRRRCLVPADGFYEWAPDESAADEGSGRRRPRKQPYWIHRPDRRPFTLAGIWERWRPREGGGTLHTFSILTTEARGRLRTLHSRMPVVISARDRSRWLDREASAESLAGLLATPAEEPFDAWPVDPAVGSPSFDNPSCLDPFPGSTPPS